MDNLRGCRTCTIRFRGCWKDVCSVKTSWQIIRIMLHSHCFHGKMTSKFGPYFLTSASSEIFLGNRLAASKINSFYWRPKTAEILPQHPDLSLLRRPCNNMMKNILHFSHINLNSVFGSVQEQGASMAASSQCGKTWNSLSLKKISSNQLFSNFFSKTVALTKFL